MRKILSLTGLLVGTIALVVLGFTGTATAAPATPDSGAGDGALVAPDKKGAPAPRPDVTTQAHLDGYCELYEFCLYFDNGRQGGLADFLIDDANYGDNFFAGTSTPVANNARSGVNNDPFFFVVACNDVNYGGMCGVAPPFVGGDLFPDYFENLESHYFTF